MEASLTVSVRCNSEAQRDFVRLMLSDDPDRLLFEDEVAASARGWFTALEDIQSAEWVEAKGADTVHAGWTLGGWEWEEEVKEILQGLKGARVAKAVALVAGDEGWYALWVPRDGKVTRHDKWQGRSLERLFGGKKDLAAALDAIME